MIRKGIFYLTLQLYISFGLLQAQTYDVLIANTLSAKDIINQLPPIEELQDQAIKFSPLLKMYQADVVIKELKILSAKREWMENLGFEAGAKYGLFDNLILTGELGIDQVATNTTEQTRYNFGVFIKIPLSSILDRSSVQEAKVEMEKATYQREAIINDLRQLIIIQYNNIVKAHRGIVVQNNTVELFRVQMLLAEKELQNGQIPVTEFARLNDMLSKAVLGLEDSKVEYITAIQLLQETVGVDIKLEN